MDEKHPGGVRLLSEGDMVKKRCVDRQLLSEGDMVKKRRKEHH